MYQTHRTYIRAEMKMADLVNENPRLLLLLERLNVDFVVGDKTVAQLCSINALPLSLFLLLGNLYNGFSPVLANVGSATDIEIIIRFLKNSHLYYKTDKYPEIIGYINQLPNTDNADEVKLIELFFKDYFNEVLEHLAYEDQKAFPYFMHLLSNSRSPLLAFSVNEYRLHHSDIETKLADLKNLLLKHIHISGAQPLRRKLFFSLLELEYDLLMHALIEEVVLLPLIEEVEKNNGNG